jgi:hypothetical protein
MLMQMIGCLLVQTLICLWCMTRSKPLQIWDTEGEYLLSQSG